MLVVFCFIFFLFTLRLCMYFIIFLFTFLFMFILLIEQKNEPRKLTRLTKICTRHAASNKISHGTRYAQTPGNFYCFLANAAKFLMPRLHLTRTFLLLNLVYSDFVSSFASTFYQRYYETYGVVAFKNYGNIVVF